jgi:hypothetical protein
MMPLAQFAVGSVAWYGIVLILIVAVVGIALAVLHASGVSVPPEVARIGWIVVVAVVGILAILLLVRLAGMG